MRPLLTDDEFEIVRRILEKSAGLVHDETRRDSLAFSVAGRVDATGCASVAAYLGLLAGPRGEVERQKLIDVVTIQETHFFRNPPQVRALRRYVLPELIRRCVAADRPLTIWSAGCSTGEEPYTLAMLARELLPMATRDHVRIVGSDISASAIAFAQAGRYGPRAVQMAEPTDLARWFVVDNDTYAVRDEVRELVEFRLHNLVTEAPPFEPGGIDLLLCRNVTIYFGRATTKALMAGFHAALSDGGYLFLGHSETLWQLSDAFTLVPLGDAFVYRRDDGDRRLPIPDRRTEEGDPPIFLRERRARADRRKRAPGGRPQPQDGRSVTLPASPALPPAANSPAANGPAAKPPATWSPLGLPASGAGRPAPKPELRAPAKPERRPSGKAEPRPAPVRQDRAGDALGHLETARNALAKGRYADAVVAAARAAKSDPLLVDPHLVSGEALVNLGRDADAVRELRQAVYLRPDFAPAHLLLAGALDRLGEPAAAGRAYRSAASTVSDLTAEEMKVFFGGRSADELVDLCIRLAMQAERAARKNGMAGGDKR